MRCGRSSTHLKLATSASNANGSLIAYYLGSDHSHRLTLGRIDLSGHDTATRFIFGKAELAKSTARARTEVSNVVSNFHEGAGHNIESSVRFDQSVVVCESLKLCRETMLIFNSYKTTAQ